MSDKKIGIALVGTGGVAHMHAEGWQSLSQARLVGAYSRTLANVTAFAEKYGIKGYTSLDEVLQDDEVDAVAILTPIPTHMSTAIACLEAGKHVLVEKPVGVSIEEVEALREAAVKSGRICMPNHNYIYAPAILRAKQYITEGHFGKLSSMWLMYNQKHWPEMGTPGLALWDLCIHHVYSMLYLIGKPVRVTALGSNIFFSNPTAVDQISIQAEMEHGAIVNLWGSFGVDDKTSNPWTVYYKVLGTEGGFAHSWDDLQFGEATLPGWDRAAYRDSFLYTQSYFLNNCIAQGEAPLSSLDDALDAVCILNAAEKAMTERRWVDIEYCY